MAIGWAHSDGTSGVYDSPTEAVMEQQVNTKTKTDREELPPQERINQAFGEGPTSELKDQNAPNSWGMGEEMKNLGTLPDAPDSEWEKEYGTKDFHQQLASFQQRLDKTPPEEASAFRKFLGSLNIMPAPGKPESEWTAKEHLGVMLNQAMAGMGGGFKTPPRGPVGVVPPKTVITPAIEQLAKYEELSSQGKTTKQIVKGSKLAPEQVREALGRDNLAIAAFNSENALTNAYFKSLENLDSALGEALKKQVSVKDLKRYTRGLPEERLKTIFEELPSHVKEAFESGEQRRINIDAGKKSKVIPKPLK